LTQFHEDSQEVMTSVLI